MGSEKNGSGTDWIEPGGKAELGVRIGGQKFKAVGMKKGSKIEFPDGGSGNAKNGCFSMPTALNFGVPIRGSGGEGGSPPPPDIL